MLIVVDSSAFLSILLGEPDAGQIASSLQSASQRISSAVTIYETRTVLLRRADRRYLDPFESLLSVADLKQHAFDERQADIASQAYARFGRGSGSPAKLNLADCASYALAISLDAPLLYKGNDFAQTDVRSALTD
ncbi:type II toxin-antitoxin system VapC family toxin [Chelatococcus asaccharovorans]|uniref:Ribonuclease VapC n=1 Tax=Chelatococcus asaccharovorans TaxID=28210 RepID=A0A2V3U2D5_9HYPH|nr:type II toxin-antitoxin system VapC family toxin [Chelatococcus asaccharovorans]MBS7702357.1 type II toxin-antitoxin system VapC family toxin [Chelatococcus asaccharovorans]PXW56441.1 ribonuclease VapC [Chelatococcus asaccharovorans]CAH1669818.1 Ribonuclease VapC28 [Chelatococcus asaccharovorans]CAH1678717.1 Ribonuclease VapC28 [Chelatococcus asaccharovorans]